MRQKLMTQHRTLTCSTVLSNVVSRTRHCSTGAHVLVGIQQGAGWVSPLPSFCGATWGHTGVPPVPAAVCNLCGPCAAGHASRVASRPASVQVVPLT